MTTAELRLGNYVYYVNEAFEINEPEYGVGCAVPTTEGAHN